MDKELQKKIIKEGSKSIRLLPAGCKVFMMNNTESQLKEEK